MGADTSSAAVGELPKPIEEAAAKASQVQQDLAVAEAELNLTNTVLGRARDDAEESREDVRKAVRQNAATEEKVGGAAEELQEVTELLQEEISERERLEQELERRARH